VRHDRYVVFQLAAVAVSRSLFAPGQSPPIKAAVAPGIRVQSDERRLRE
jgi:hypothetical protein